MQKLLWLNRRFAKFFAAAVLVIVPLFPKFPLISVPGTYVAIRFEDLLLLILGILTLIAILSDMKSFFKDKIAIAILIFFAVGAVSLVSAAYVTKTINPSLGILHLLRRVEYISAFFAGLYLFRKNGDGKNLGYFIKLILLVTFVAFVYGLGQKYWHFPIIVTQNQEYSKGIALRWTPGSHINSTFAGHYDLAATMVIFLPIMISLFFVFKDKWSRILLFLGSGAGLWLLINSVSRISQASYVLAISVALIFVKKFKELAVILAISLVLIATSSGLDARFGRLIQVVKERLTASIVLADEITLPQKTSDGVMKATPTPIPVFEDRSTSIRLNAEWPAAMRAFEKNPILGTGYSSIGLAADNDYLRTLAEVGILGFASFTLIFIRIFWEFKDTLSLTKKFSGEELAFLAGMYGGVLGTFVSCIFIDLFEASKFAILFWFFLGYSVFMVRNRLYDQKK